MFTCTVSLTQHGDIGFLRQGATQAMHQQDTNTGKLTHYVQEHWTQPYILQNIPSTSQQPLLWLKKPCIPLFFGG